MKLRLVHKGLALVSVILALELAFLGVLYGLLRQTEEIALKAGHAKKLMGALNHIWATWMEANRNSIPIYTAKLDPNKPLPEDLKKTLALFRSTSQKYIERMDEYSNLLAEAGRRPSERTKSAMDKGKKYMRALGMLIGLVEKGNLAGALALLEKMNQKGIDLKRLEGDLVDDLLGAREDERAILAASPRLEEESRNSIRILLIVGILFNIAVAVLLATIFSDKITRRLNVVVENTSLLMDNKPLLPPMPDEDEIGLLDRTFHEMADKLAEAARKERAIVMNARDVILSLDENLCFVSVSPAAQSVWGYESNELIKEELSKILQGDDLSATADSIRAAKKGALSLENRVCRKDGSSLDMLWSVRWHEETASFFCVAHDITERKQNEELLKASEARIRAILDNMVVGILTLNPDSRIESVNPRIEQMLKINSSELIAHSFQSLLPAYQDPMKFDELRRQAQSHVVELVVPRQDGSQLPVEFSLTAFESAQGARLLANLVDITERYELDRMKQEFVAMISHDLRTPLTSVQGYLELLSDGIYGDLTKKGSQGADLALRNVGRLLRLVNDLLDIAKVDAGQLELALAPADLHGIIERSVEAVRVFAEQHTVKLEFSSIPATLNVDADRLERVIVNLLSNAVKFSPPNGVVTVYSELAEGVVKVNIKDRGRGIPASHIDLIFERFKQVQTSDATKKGGTGLGLSICKAIVEQHGGTIGVSSLGIEGEGSTFWFGLPASAVVEKVCAAAEQVEEVPSW